MKALIIAAALIAAPAQAKTWVDQTCEHTLVTTNEAFVFLTPDDWTICHVDSWPISETTATMACEDGSTPEMSFIGDRTVHFASVEMNLYEGPLPCGYDGAEWPD